MASPIDQRRLRRVIPRKVIFGYDDWHDLKFLLINGVINQETVMNESFAGQHLCRCAAPQGMPIQLFLKALQCEGLNDQILL